MRDSRLEWPEWISWGKFLDVEVSQGIRIVTAMKYTKEILATAVRDAHTMADVMRNLGIVQSGGMHAHLKRRIVEFGIDTSHFGRRAPNKGKKSPRRSQPSEVLVRRPPGSRRVPAEQLRRMLQQVGREYRCEECDTDGTWNGQSLTLHVDHINGDYLDSRCENLRFLCPNCHSQTATYSGANRRRFTISEQGLIDVQAIVPHQEYSDVVDLMDRINRGDASFRDAATELGCTEAHVYKLRRELARGGQVEGRTFARDRVRAVRNSAIIALALDNPEWGPKRLAAHLLRNNEHGWNISRSSVSHVLEKAGLGHAAERRRVARRREEQRE